MKVSVLGIDLGKNICSIVGLDASGTVVWFQRGVATNSESEPRCMPVRHVYLVPNETADQFRAMVQGGLGVIYRVVHSDKANPDTQPSESSQTKAPAETIA